MRAIAIAIGISILMVDFTVLILVKYMIVVYINC